VTDARKGSRASSPSTGQGQTCSAAEGRGEVGRRLLTGVAKRLRHEMTNAERVLWGEVRAHRLSGFKFKRQEPLGVYVVDFVCYEARLIIELDGGHHANQQEADAERTLWLESSGFRVIRFWNNDVLSNIAEVMQEIEREITAPLPLSSALSRERRASSESILSSGHCSPSSSKSPSPSTGEGRGEGE